MSLFRYALLFVNTSFAVILKRKRKLVAFLLLSYRCSVAKNDLWLPYGAVAWFAVCNCGISWSYSFTCLSVDESATT